MWLCPDGGRGDTATFTLSLPATTCPTDARCCYVGARVAVAASWAGIRLVSRWAVTDRAAPAAAEVSSVEAWLGCLHARQRTWSATAPQ